LNEPDYPENNHRAITNNCRILKHKVVSSSPRDVCVNEIQKF